MHVLFYVGDKNWSGCARAFLAAARGLAARGHDVGIACCGGSTLERRAHEFGIDPILINDPESSFASGWDLRRVLQERAIDAAFVVSERDQLIVSSAMTRLGGVVIRRIPTLETLDLQRSGKLALRIANAGLLVSSERELQELRSAGWTVPPSVAPIGIDAAAYDDIRPLERRDLGIPPTGLLIACPYEPSGRYRVATVLRTLAFLVPRHRDLHVVIVGPGSNDEELRMHAAALGVSPAVTFLGERDDESAVLRTADVGWPVAAGDGGAYAFLDLAAAKIPVVSEATPLAQQFVSDGINGVLLPAADPAVTASRVASFIAHGEARSAMANAARARVQRDFPESAMIDGFERAAQAIAGRAKATVP
ncbi:MAG TPA: glycosyltransferase family 4 protein [Gemmatimonadaceae bacterium]